MYHFFIFVQIREMKNVILLICCVLFVLEHSFGQDQVQALQERITLLKSHNIDSAKVLAREMIGIGRKNKSPKIEVQGNVILADLFYYANEREKGFEYLTDAIDICDKNGLEQLKTDIYYSIGLNYSRNARKSDNSVDKEKMELALEYHQKGIDLAAKYNDLILLSKGYNLSGVCFERIGDWNKAEEYYEKSEAYSREANDSVGLGYTLDYAGTLQAQMGNYDNAESMLLEALEIRKALKD
jgi:tetratricopeptide (TPR) repeat protein